MQNTICREIWCLPTEQQFADVFFSCRQPNTKHCFFLILCHSFSVILFMYIFISVMGPNSKANILIWAWYWGREVCCWCFISSSTEIYKYMSPSNSLFFHSLDMCDQPPSSQKTKPNLCQWHCWTCGAHSLSLPAYCWEKSSKETKMDAMKFFWACCFLHAKSSFWCSLFYLWTKLEKMSRNDRDCFCCVPAGELCSVLLC